MTRWTMTALVAGLAGFAGVALADVPDNPFEGAWLGTYELPDLGGGGTVEFSISKTGVLQGRSINDDGTGHTLIANIDADGWMHGVAIFENGGPAERFSGNCSIGGGGNLVCDLTGCIGDDCFDLVVTVAPVLALSNGVSQFSADQSIAIVLQKVAAEIDLVEADLNPGVDSASTAEATAPAPGTVTTRLDLPQCDGKLRTKFVATQAADGSWNVSAEVRPSRVQMAVHFGIDPGSGAPGTLKGIATANFVASSGIPVSVYASGLQLDLRFGESLTAGVAMSLSVGADGVVSVMSHYVSVDCVFCGVSCE